MDIESAGFGGLAKYNNREMMMAFSVLVACTSSNMAEALATEFSGKWRLTNFTLELGLMIIVNLVNNRSISNFNLGKSLR